MIPRRTVHGILVLSVLSALSFWLSRDVRRDEQTSIGGLDTSLNYALRDFEARYFDEQGRLAARVEAPLLTNDASTGIGRIDQPRFRVVHEGNLWTILSESATVTPDRERVQLAGAVQMVRVEPGSLRQLDIQTREVTVEIDPRIAHSTEHVVITEGENVLEATGFRLDMSNNQFQLAQGVRGTYAIP
jgi:lipopolysaccharide export system protein LptC